MDPVVVLPPAVKLLPVSADVSAVVQKQSIEVVPSVLDSVVAVPVVPVVAVPMVVLPRVVVPVIPVV